MPTRGRPLAMIAVVAMLVIAGIPALRQDASAKRPSKTYRATSRAAPGSETAELAVTGGVEASRGGDCHDRDVRRSIFGAIGLVARYDVWLNPEPSTAVARTSEKTPAQITAASRTVDASGRSEAGASTAPPSTDPLGSDYQKLSTDPRALELSQLGIAAFRRGEFLQAFDALRNASLAVPDSAIVRHALSLAQFAVGDYEGAEWSLRRALELAPELIRSRPELLPLYSRALDLEDQRRALESHLRVHPADRKAALVGAWIAYLAGDDALARDRLVGLTEDDAVDSLPPTILAELAKSSSR